MERLSILWTGVVLLAFSPHSAHAQESPIGLYAGASFGNATLRQGSVRDTAFYDFNQNDLGWNAFVGVRPIPHLGVEIGYLDFGSASRGGDGFGYYNHVSAKAPAGFAVGYLPVQPWWDFYLEAGAARLRRTWTQVFYVRSAVCPSPAECPNPGQYADTHVATQWDFAGGVGTQWKFRSLALRVEYQRVSTGGNTYSGDPDLLSVGVSWTFF